LNHRYIGDLNDHQIVTFRAFKDWIDINFENAAHNPWMTDQFLIRFCRARKFELQKVCEMFTNYMAYRKDNKIDTIMGVSTTFPTYIYIFKCQEKTNAPIRNFSLDL
jgi:hypothetical protein